VSSVEWIAPYIIMYYTHSHIGIGLFPSTCYVGTYYMRTHRRAASRLLKRVGLRNKNTNTKEENKVTAFTLIRTLIRTPIPASYTSFRIIRSSSLCRGRLTDTRTRDTRLTRPPVRQVCGYGAHNRILRYRRLLLLVKIANVDAGRSSFARCRARHENR